MTSCRFICSKERTPHFSCSLRRQHEHLGFIFGGVVILVFCWCACMPAAAGISEYQRNACAATSSHETSVACFGLWCEAFLEACLKVLLSTGFHELINMTFGEASQKRWPTPSFGSVLTLTYHSTELPHASSHRLLCAGGFNGYIFWSRGAEAAFDWGTLLIRTHMP